MTLLCGSRGNQLVDTAQLTVIASVLQVHVTFRACVVDIAPDNVEATFMYSLPVQHTVYSKILILIKNNFLI